MHLEPAQAGLRRGGSNPPYIGVWRGDKPFNRIRGVKSTPFARADESHGIANGVLGCIPAIGLIQGVPICAIFISSGDTTFAGRKIDIQSWVRNR